MADAVIGIDLGTRYAQLAVDLPGRGVQLIPNRWGQKRTPSVVACTKDGLIAGEEAAKIGLVQPRSLWWDLSLNSSYKYLNIVALQLLLIIYKLPI